VNCTLGELYKKHQVCTKIRLFEIQYRFFSVEGAQPLPQTPPPVRTRTSLPISHLFDSILAPTALESGDLRRLVPQLLILEPPLFGSHTSVLGNDPCFAFLISPTN